LTHVRQVHVEVRVLGDFGGKYGVTCFKYLLSVSLDRSQQVQATVTNNTLVMFLLDTLHVCEMIACFPVTLSQATVSRRQFAYAQQRKDFQHFDHFTAFSTSSGRVRNPRCD
jgi:hypothetical protein